MVVSTTLSLAGAGTRFTGEFRKMGRVEPKLSHKPRKHFGWFCINRHQLLNCKCFWQIPGNRNLMNFKPRDLPLHFSYGKDAKDSSLLNVNEDTAEMFDNLFKKYGKVVFKRTDQKPPTAEIDDDAESLSCKFFRSFVTASSRIRDLAEKEYGKVPSGDSKPNSWTLLDFGDVVILVFLPQQRALYNLEEFYGNATAIELPFENQPPFGS